MSFGRKRVPVVHLRVGDPLLDGKKLYIRPISASRTKLTDKGTDSRQFKQSLSSCAWESWLRRCKQAGGTIQMPRFKLDYCALLERELKALGMEGAFDPDLAEFDGVRAGQFRVWIDQVLHRAVLEVWIVATLTCFTSSSPA